MVDEQASEWRAPYVAYQTLVNLLDEKLGPNPLPYRIDRGFLESYAGSVQAQILATLKTIGLIADDGTVQASLRQAVRGPEERKEVLRSWAEPFYKEQTRLARDSATAQMLHESFAKHGYSGSTLRKAIVFYLALAEDVGLPIGTYFKPPRQPSTPLVRSRRKPEKPPQRRNEVPASATPAEAIEQKTISFGPAGEVTVWVNVKWLELPDATFMGLRKAIRDLEQLATKDAQVDEDA